MSAGLAAPQEPPWRTLARALNPHRRLLAGVVVLSVAGTIGGIAIPLLIGSAIAAIESADRGRLEELTALVIAVALGAGVIASVRGMIANHVSLAVVARLRELAFTRLQTLDVTFFERQQTGQLVSRLTSDLDAVAAFLGMGLGFTLTAVCTMVGAGITMFVLDVPLAALALAPLLVSVYLGVRFSVRLRQPIWVSRQAFAEVTALIEENLAGFAVVKAFAAQGRAVRRVTEACERQYRRALAVIGVQTIYIPSIALLPSVGLLVVVAYGSLRVIEHEAVSAGEWVSFFAFLLVLVETAEAIGSWIASGSAAMTAVTRTNAILAVQPAVTDRPGAPPLPPGGGIELVDVTLGGAAADGRVEVVRLTAAPGRRVAIIGRSGSGKSALLRLVNRLTDPATGTIRIAGTTISDVELHSLRRRIGVAADGDYLFSASVHDNIAFGRPDAPREAVERAARAAEAHAFITQLPDGYDTVIAEGGASLSGGQRQRLVLARALLIEPSVLLLDNATGGLDAVTAGRVDARLARDARDRVEVNVTARANTIEAADDVLVLDAGRVVAAGPPAQVASATPLYERLVGRVDAGPMGLPGDGDGGATASDTEEEREEEATAAAPAAGASEAAAGGDGPPAAEAEWAIGGLRRRLRGLSDLLSPHPWLLAGAFASVAVAVGTTLLPPLLAGIAVTEVLARDSAEQLAEITLALAAALVLYWPAQALQTRLMGRLGQGAVADLRIAGFDHLQKLSMRTLDRARRGAVLSRLTNDVGMLSMFVTQGLSLLVSGLLTFVGSAAILFVLDFELALVAFAVLPVLGLATWVFGHLAGGRFAAARQAVGSLTAFISESLAGVRSVRNFAVEDRQHAGFERVNHEVRLRQRSASWSSSVYVPIVQAAGLVALALVVLVGGEQAIAGTIAVGVVVSFMAYLRTMLATLPDLATVIGQFFESGAALDRILALLDLPAEEAARDAPPLKPAGGAIAVEDVWFRYADDARWAVRELDLAIPARSTLAIVGETGAGKSTLAKLLTRFYDPSRGRLLIDGVDIADVNLDSLRRSIGYVAQEPLLFSASVRDNVRYGAPDASDADVERMIARCGGTRLLERLPDGLDTPVGAGGTALSSGQLGLVGLARALLPDPPIVVLDEATASLDAETAAEVDRGLERILAERTAIVIAHRLETIVGADRIAVFADGRVVQLGTHAELLAAGGPYARMHREWSAAGRRA